MGRELLLPAPPRIETRAGSYFLRLSRSLKFFEEERIRSGLKGRQCALLGVGLTQEAFGCFGDFERVVGSVLGAFEIVSQCCELPILRI